MSLLATNLTPERYSDWDAFCLVNRGAWYWHTTDFLTLQAMVRPEARSAPDHWWVQRGNEMLALCPFATERVSSSLGERTDLVLGGDLLAAPVFKDGLSDTERKKVERFVWEEIERRSIQKKVSRGGFRAPVLVPEVLFPSRPMVNPVLGGAGWFDASLHTQVLDLRGEENRLWSGLRDSYHSLIHRDSEKFIFSFYDGHVLEHGHFEEYRELHHRAAGRLTRPLETFSKMEETIRRGEAGLALARTREGGRTVGAIYVYLYKNKGYYGSACNDPDLASDHALGHFLQWNVILELKRKSITHYELGWQFRGSNLFYLPTREEAAIAFFKRGFGGDVVPFYRSVRFFERDRYDFEMKEKTSALSGSLFPSPGAS